MSSTFDPRNLRALLAAVRGLTQQMRAAAARRGAAIDAVPPAFRPSARNLIHYLTVRAHDLRALQRDLAALSLSSLGRMEGHALATVAGVERALMALLGEMPPAGGVPEPACPSAEEAQDMLAARTAQLLGERPHGRQARIMVTLPGEAGRDPELLQRLLLAGMDLVRINLAHDDPATWSAMVTALRTAEQATGRRCRVFVDLPGPKLRTGDVEPGPCVVRVQPQRDAFGRTIEPAVLTFVEPGGPAEVAGTRAPLHEPVGQPVCRGDEFVVTDTRGRRRVFVVVDGADGAFVCRGSRTCYLAPDCEVVLRRAGTRLWRGRLGELPARPGAIPLAVGDRLVLTRVALPGRAARPAAGAPARVSCTLPEVFAAARPGQRVLFDDGKLTARIEACGPDELTVRIVEAPPGGARLRAQKGINLPDTDLQLQALTAQDRQCLDWVAAHADVVGMSFVQQPDDVIALHQELERRGRGDMGIVLKIETRLAFDRLPELLLSGLRSPPLGVMVARGDLAVEVGFARLAEVQEEILWFCEAAHVPVIWATQVLDSMARTGTPSRAEVTDAAMSVRAECVMLNKGPYVAETVQFLAGVLERMQAHHAKKSSMLRSLHVAGDPTALSASPGSCALGASSSPPSSAPPGASAPAGRPAAADSPA